MSENWQFQCILYCLKKEVSCTVTSNVRKNSVCYQCHFPNRICTYPTLNAGNANSKLHEHLKFSGRLQQTLCFLEVAEALRILHGWTARVMDIADFDQKKDVLFSSNQYGLFGAFAHVSLVSITSNVCYNLLSICTFPLLWKAKMDAFF